MLIYRLEALKVHDRRLRRPKPFQRQPINSIKVRVMNEARDTFSLGFGQGHLDAPWEWCVENIGGLWNGWGLEDNRFLFADDSIAFGFKMRFDGAPVEVRRR